MPETKAQAELKNAISNLDIASIQKQDVITSSNYQKSYQKALKNIDQDMAQLKTQNQTLFGNHVENSDGANGAKLADLYSTWRDDGPPSVPAILMHAADVMGIDKEEPSFKAAVMTGIAAEIELENSYHDNHHFREVVTAALRYCVTNNEMAADGQTELMSGKDIAKTLLAAAGHDLNHDGTGNHENGEHIPYRLEQKSLDAMAPYMAAAGMAQQDIQDVKTAIRVTDVSQPRDGVSPHTHLKTIAKAAETGAKVDISEIPAELQALTSNKILLQTASILSDADLTPSAGTTYDFNQRMTENLHGEVPAISVGPGTTQFFCQQIVGGAFTSAAGQKHSNASLTGMVNTAKKISMQLENANKVETPKAKKDGTSNKI